MRRQGDRLEDGPGFQTLEHRPTAFDEDSRHREDRVLRVDEPSRLRVGILEQRNEGLQRRSDLCAVLVDWTRLVWMDVADTMLTSLGTGPRPRPCTARGPGLLPSS